MKRGRPVGYRESDETKMKRRRSMLGRKLSEETKKKISESISKHYDSLSKKEHELLYRIYDSKTMSIKDMAKLFQCSYHQIYRLIRRRDNGEKE